MKLPHLVTLVAVSLLIHPAVAGAQWGHVSINTPISIASGHQITVVSVSDGAGGAVCVWADNRNGNYDIFAQRVNASGQVQWAPDGVPVRVALNNQTNPAIAPDGGGGVIVFWEHLANNGSTDIYADHITPAGEHQWLNPTLICGAQHDQSSPRAVRDGTDGVIVVWQDNRQGSTMVADVYAQRVNMSGAVSWTSDGVAICTAGSKQTFARLVHDGSGGAIFAWCDQRLATNVIYARRVTSTGLVQWTADGVALSANTGNEAAPSITTDGAGGAIVAWHGDGASFTDIYAQRINSSGAVEWTPGGILICDADLSQLEPAIVADGAGGAFVAWQDLRDTVTLSDEDVYAQRIDASGVAQWASNGIAVCTEDGAGTQTQIISDGAGGAVVVWADTRLLGYDIYAQRVNAAGAVLWETDGAAVTVATAAQNGPAPVTDGFGGVIVAWNDYRSGTSDVYANRITGGGVIPTPVRDTPAVSSIVVNTYPNPFSAATSIEITSNRDAPVSVGIFDVSGRRVRSLNVGRVDALTRTISFDGRDEHGTLLPSGLYFCRIQSAGETVTRKLVIQR